MTTTDATQLPLPRFTLLSSNRDKIREFAEFLGDIHAVELDIIEPQDLDVENISLFKLKSALEMTDGITLVEDTSLTFDGMGLLPGTLIKWFLAELKQEGLAKLADRMGNCRATAMTVIACGGLPCANITSTADSFTVKGTTEGTIVSPRGSYGFGWDSIFQPIGSSLTFGEMCPEEKAAFSMRRKALSKLQQRIARSSPTAEYNC